MINDQYLKIGQTVSGLTVEDVTQEGVVLRKDNVSFRLSVIRNWAFGK
jgi:general secretion pathway protein B